MCCDMKLIYGLSFVFVLAGCVTPPKSAPPSVSDVYGEIKVDYERLQTHLGLDRPIEDLGYFEKQFPTCEVGFGYPSNRQCIQEHFILIHFQLLCRQSTQNTYYEAIDSYAMEPVRASRIRWSLDGRSGYVNLDDRGYGQIRTTGHRSLRNHRLKLVAGNENLRIKAGTLKQIVTTPSWCR